MRTCVLSLLLAASGTGCFDVQFEEGIACSPMGNCPLGMMCVAGVCLDDEHVPDGGVPSPTALQRVAAGEDHSCAIDVDGDLACWGRNGDAQLGLPQSRMEPPTPATVAGPWVEVGAGQRHVCALKANGDLWCWGNNDEGQLGVPGRTDTAQPPGVWRHVAVGAIHTCAIDDGGDLYCWGWNGEGQIGVVPSPGQVVPAPERVPGGPWRQASLGISHTCAIEDGESPVLKCWGAGDYGQLGTGGEEPSPSPTAIMPTLDVSRVAAGYFHTCAIAVGHLYCTGTGLATGLGDAASSLVPVEIGTFTDWAWVGAGAEHTCALRENGDRYCFGFNAFGQLGDDSNVSLEKGTLPTAPQDGGWTQVDGGTYHTCGLKGTGEVACWGGNEWGQVTQPPAQRATPVPVSIPSAGMPLQVSANGEEGRAHTCAIVSPGQLWCWGSNDYGQLGLGSATSAIVQTTVPQQVGTDETWTKVVTGGYHTCALKGSGDLYCWGLNEASQCGVSTGAILPEPTRVEDGGLTYTDLALGKYHTCAVESGGILMCTGDNEHGQVGDSSTSTSRFLYRHFGVTYSRVYAGDYHSCAQDSTAGGVLVCWGKNEKDQVGHAGAQDPQTSPIGIDGGWQPTDGDGGREHTCFQHVNDVYCFGSNESGQLGNETVTTWTPTATQILPAFTETIAVDAGVAHTCAIDGVSLSCWGSNDFLQLGDGGEGRSTPAAVTFSSEVSVLDVAAGPFHTCAITQGATVAIECWGSDGYGQLGDDRAWQVLPQPVELP